MDSSVVFRAARGLTDAGLAVLRFNFRGVGESAGSQGEGDEEGDLEAALCYLGQQWPSTPLWAGGWALSQRSQASKAAAQPPGGAPPTAPERRFLYSKLFLWGRSSAGRALRSQCRGRGFEPPRLHHNHLHQPAIKRGRMGT